MLLNSRTTRLLIEAAEDAGLSRASILDPLGIQEHDVVDPHVKVEWTTVTRLAEQISLLVGGDEEQLRDIGRRMSGAPSYAPLRRMAGAMISVRRLYDIANRYAVPANFPHLTLTARFQGDRMLLHAEIPTSYTPCVPFFHVSIGSVAQLPTLLGLPPAKVLSSRVGPYSADVEVIIPPSRSLGTRLRLGARAVLGARDALAVLEEHQRELADNVEALKRARDELGTLLERLPDLVVVHASGNVLWGNAALLSALDVQLKDIVGRPLTEIVVGKPGAVFDDPAPAEALAVPGLIEVALRTRSRSEIVVEVAPTQNVVFDGVAARLLVGRDVTERRRLQQNLILADRLASVGMLAAGVAHEVNNPLAYVLNNIEMAMRELVSLGPEADSSRRALGVALEGVDRIRVIVRDLLMLARGEEGAVRTVDVRDVAKSTLALAAHDIEQTTKLVVDLGPAPTVQGSDGRIAQVLINLLTNAVEAMRGRPREDNTLVVRVARATDGRLVLEVSDTGTGIAPANLPHLFEPFFTTKSAGRGTGLGLSIAQRLVVELGGEITVASQPGRGTTFRVLLPAAAGAEGASHEVS